MHRTIVRLLFPGSAIATLLASALPAQSARPGDEDTLRARRDTASLPAVTITATRTPRPLLATPLAVTRVTREEIRRGPGMGLDQALAQVPGVLVQSRYGSGDVRLVVRGFGARGAGDRSNAGTNRGVRVLLDGIPETEPDGRTSFDNIDLDAAYGIDVVRSNASSLWGNAAGGVINVSTVPDGDAPAAMLQTSTGSYGLRRWVGQASTSIGTGLLYGTISRSEFEGWRAHSDSRRTVANAGVVMRLGARTSAAVFAAAADNLFHIPGPLSPAEAASNPSAANATYAARDERRHNRLGRLGVTVDHAINPGRSVSGMLFVSPKFLQRSERGTFRDFTRYHVGGNLVLRQAGTLSSSVRHELTAGVDEAYQDGAILFYSLSPANTRGTTLRDNKREGANNLGVFIQEELTIGDRFTLLAGVRDDAIRYIFQSFITPALDDVRTFRGVTPKLGALYRFTPTQSAYVNLGGGVEVPAGNEVDPAGTFGTDTITGLNPLLDPIRSTTAEAGIRGLLVPAGHGPVSSVSYDLASYVTNVRNEIVPYRGGRFYFTAGRARRTGLEAGASVGTSVGLRARGTLTLSRNRYTNYVVDSAHYGRPGARADYSGNRMVGVPDLMASAALRFAPPRARWISMEFASQRMGSYFADDANRIRVPAFGTSSAYLTAHAERIPGVGMRATLGVENLLDRRHIGSAFLNPDIVGGQPQVYEPGQPRTFFITVSVQRSR